MSSHWTEAKLFKFLRLYKRYECLWNPYSPGYKNCDEKSEAFSQILYEMNVFGLTFNECLNQIKHIRKTYKQEQQRLESLASLGGRGFSNLLWYPLMNSMLSKVIQDEEKLNQAAGNLDLVVAPKHLPLNSGDQLENRRDFVRSGYRQRTVSWDDDETTTAICPYVPNSNFGDYMNCYPNLNILNNCIETCEPNEHISSCPTCGYSSSCSCNCSFSIDSIGYNSGNIGQGYTSSQSQINYRPRTSYNYRNGILEINSAVRIPVSHPSPNYGHSDLVESTIPEEPEHNFNTISSNHQPEVETVKEKEESLTKCCEKSTNDKDEENEVNGQLCKSSKIPDNAAHSSSNPSNLPATDNNDLPMNNINWSLKKSKRAKGNVDEVLCGQDSLGLIGTPEESICKSIKHENTGKDIDKASQGLDQKNQTNDVDHAAKVEFKNSFDIKQEILPSVALENEHKTEGKILTAECSRLKKFETNYKLDLQGLRKTETTGIVSNKNLLDVIDDSNEKISDLETDQDLVQKSKSIVKHNLTKFVIDFIDETLNKPDKMSAANTEERLILKKVSKDLKALRNESNRICNRELAMEDYQQSQKNRRLKFCNKTICWREPIEESLNIVPCKSTRSSAQKIDNKKKFLAERSMQLNKGTGHCFRMMAGADADIDNDIQQPNIFSRQYSDRLTNEKTTTHDSAFGHNKKTGHENFMSHNCQEDLILSMDKKQQCNDETDSQIVADLNKNQAYQTNSTEEAANEVVASSNSNCKVTAGHKNLEVLLSRNENGKKKRLVIIDKLFKAEESIESDLRNVEKDGQIIMMESNLNGKIRDDQIDNLKCYPGSDSHGTKIGNSVTIHVSVERSEITENEVIDKVVHKITHVLRKTLDKNGFAIEKKQFFKKKSLITNDNGEIQRKMIGCEAVWKTELRNIIRNLMKQKKVGDPITFKVKTMILPVANQSNDVSAEATINLSSSTKPRQKLARSKKGKEIGIHKTGTSSQIEKAQYETSGDEHEIFFEKGGNLYDEGEDQHTRIMENSESDLKPDRMARANASSDVTKREEINCKMPSKDLPGETTNSECNEQFTDLDSDTLLYKSNRDIRFKKQFSKNQMRNSRPRKRQNIPRFILKNVTRLDKILFDDVNRNIPRYEDYPHALSKLMKYLVRFRNVFQSIPKKNEKSSRNELQRNKYEIMDNRKLEQNHHKSDFDAENLSDKLPRNPNADIDVYLCTEISQEDQSPMQKQSGYQTFSKGSICNDINTNSLSTSTSASPQEIQMKNTENNRVQKTVSMSEQDVSEWESFSDSDEGTEVLEHCRHRNKSSPQISKRQSEKNTVYSLTRTTKNTVWYPEHANQVELSDMVNRPTNKFHSMPNSQENGLKDELSSQNNCKIIDIFSSDNQNICQNEVRSSEEGSEASLYSAEFEEMEKANSTYRIPKPSESEEGQSLFEAKLRVATDNEIKSCCTGDKTTGNVCTPICDVTSRSRLCAIMKLPDETSTANQYYVPSNNICCCDDMDKLKNADPAYLGPRMKPGQRNVMIGEASVRLVTESCQTEPFKTDLKPLDPQSHASSQDYRKASNSGLKAACDGTYRQNSTVIESTIITTNKNIEQPDNVDHSKSNTIKRATVRGNTQDSVATSLDGSLILEIKMLEPLFSIELKKGCKDSVKTVKETSCELLEQNNHVIVVSSTQEPVVIESSSGNGVISPAEQQSINCINESTPINSINREGEKMVDQEVESFMQKCKEEVCLSGTQLGTQICKMTNDPKERNEVFSDDRASSVSTASNELKHNASTCSGGQRDCLDPGQCNKLHETLGSLKTYGEPCEIINNEFPVHNCVTCAEKVISQPEETSSDETQSRTIKSLISTVETSLQHLTDPMVREKLIDMIKYIRDQDQNENYSSTEIYPGDQTCGTSEKTLEKYEMEVQIKSEENIRPLQSLLSIGKHTECQKSCVSESVFIANNSRNSEEIMSVVEISRYENQSTQSEGAARNSHTKMEGKRTNGSAVRLLPGEKCYCRNQPRLILKEQATSRCDEACSSNEIGARNKARSESLLSRSISKSQMLEAEENLFVSENERSYEFGENSHLMSCTFNYSSNEISCDIEGVETETSKCDPNINETLNKVSQLQNYENYESSEYNCCHTEVDINAFASMVASELRGLSTEAALRSQQRIQTLISNSRLEWDKNKKYR